MITGDTNISTPLTIYFIRLLRADPVSYMGSLDRRSEWFYSTSHIAVAGRPCYFGYATKGHDTVHDPAGRNLLVELMFSS